LMIWIHMGQVVGIRVSSRTVPLRVTMHMRAVVFSY
jgi:hypothetical protein